MEKRILDQDPRTNSKESIENSKNVYSTKDRKKTQIHFNSHISKIEFFYVLLFFFLEK